MSPATKLHRTGVRRPGGDAVQDLRALDLHDQHPGTRRRGGAELRLHLPEADVVVVVSGGEVGQQECSEK